MTDSNRFERLSPRQRQCLAGVRELKGSKEIAEELGIEKSTVNGYLTDAVRILGAKNRRDAAMMLEQYEQEVSQKQHVGQDPYKIGGDSARLAAPPAQPPEASVLADATASEPQALSAATVPSIRGLRLPVRRKGQRGNDLSVGERLLWIPAIAIGLSVGFGMLASGLQVLARVIGAVGNLAH